MSQNVSNGTFVMFTCNAIAFPAPSYNWTTPTGNISNTHIISLTADYDDFGNYTCLAISNGTIATSQPALLTGTNNNMYCVCVCVCVHTHAFMHSCMCARICVLIKCYTNLK